MSSLNCLTPKDFTKDHHKKGYKELGGSYVRIAFSQDDYSITEPLHEGHLYQEGNEEDYEYIVWKKDTPIAEFKALDDAHSFLKLKLEESK